MVPCSGVGKFCLRDCVRWGIVECIRGHLLIHWFVTS